MDQDATQVIAEHGNISVEDDVFDRFMSACEKAKKPNNALLEAAAFTKDRDIK